MKKIDKSLIIGYILLLPATISVLLFLITLLTKTDTLDLFVNSAWTGTVRYLEGGGGYTSALPIYFGLMAIAGAYLIKDKN